ncbi:MAG: peptide chain release factor 1 [Clostridiales bacterium]|jgi:peptide chain release factor 1|nr:peptide chain release factor 1 [Clostridiales bacterium]
MFDKLESIEERYDELGQMLADPEVINDQKKFQQTAKNHADLQEIVETYRYYKKVKNDLEEAKSLLEEDNIDDDLREMAEMEQEELSEKIEDLQEKLKILLLPKDPNDEKNVIMEIRAGAGGEEAALFAGDLFRMYSRYAENQGWKIELMNSHPTDTGGFKEIIFTVEGQGAFSKLKFESGVHRVQRVPATESSGRIHTSTATVAVLPEAEEVDVEIDPNDLRIDVFCSSGPGGQSVNTTQSAVRVTHIPTGIVVSCQDEKSQHKNKAKALKVLRSRLHDKMLREQQEEVAGARKLQVGTGDRSERIRTYNFPQGRVTDHRIGLTLHKLEAVLQGELDELIESLRTEEQAEKLKEVE